MIEIIKGNLLETSCDILMHGVNCSGGFASGVAGQIAKKWPSVKADYLYRYNYNGWNLGDVQFVINPLGILPKYIVNCATQMHYGKDKNIVYCNYDAINVCLEKVLKFANHEGYTVGMPKIGAGLANGNWEIICSNIVRVSIKYPDVSINIYEL